MSLFARSDHRAQRSNVCKRGVRSTVCELNRSATTWSYGSWCCPHTLDSSVPELRPTAFAYKEKGRAHHPARAAKIIGQQGAPAKSEGFVTVPSNGCAFLDLGQHPTITENHTFFAGVVRQRDCQPNQVRAVCSRDRSVCRTDLQNPIWVPRWSTPTDFGCHITDACPTREAIGALSQRTLFGLP